ncbi:hypothetical protein M5689_009918 [Euphorbia peplus]|nr:hypothetical protein M5689_009916 [Euphorbia peplus]WCJ28212.1 hypothetical protein M5689_009918 [Euphorbia peplus]
MNKLSGTKVIVLLALIAFIMASAVAFPVPVEVAEGTEGTRDLKKIFDTAGQADKANNVADVASNFVPSGSPGMLGAAPKFGFIMIFFYFLLH